MTKRRPLALIAVLALAGLSAAAADAQNSAAPKAGATPAPTKEQLEDAAFDTRVLVSAMQSDKVEAPVKDALFRCIYSNSMSKISETMGKVMAANPGKVDRRNPDQILGVMAGICGYRPQAAAGAKPGAAPTPAPAKPAATPTPAKPH